MGNGKAGATGYVFSIAHWPLLSNQQQLVSLRHAGPLLRAVLIHRVLSPPRLCDHVQHALVKHVLILKTGSHDLVRVCGCYSKYLGECGNRYILYCALK